MILVTGADGFIGKALAKRLDACGTTRSTLDLLNPGNLNRFGTPSAVYLCAAKTRFIDCEDSPEAYRINVDAQVELARHFKSSKIVYLSSEAIERALHTNYGLHKALCEMGLRAVCEPVIARLSKVTPETLPKVVDWLVGLQNKSPGVYRWNT